MQAFSCACKPYPAHASLLLRVQALSCACKPSPARASLILRVQALSCAVQALSCACKPYPARGVWKTFWTVIIAHIVQELPCCDALHQGVGQGRGEVKKSLLRSARTVLTLTMGTFVCFIKSYQNLSSLHFCTLISQDRPFTNSLYRRRHSGTWDYWHTWVPSERK